MAKQVGVTQSVYSRYENDQLEVPYSVLEYLRSKKKLNLDWFFSGEGEMTISKLVVADPPFQSRTDSMMVQEAGPVYGKVPAVVSIAPDGKDNVVMVPAKAAAGYMRGFADPEYIEQLPAYRLPGLRTGTYRMFEVSGDSMHPTLKPSDLVVCEYVGHLSQIRDDRVYVVVSRDEGIIVKRLLNRIQTDEKVIAKSDNTDGKLYPPIVLSPGQIQECWYVRMFISHQLSTPDEYWSRLQDLEGRVALLENRKLRNDSTD